MLAAWVGALGGEGLFLAEEPLYLMGLTDGRERPRRPFEVDWGGSMVVVGLDVSGGVDVSSGVDVSG